MPFGFAGRKMSSRGRTICSTTRSLAATGVNGNNVNLDEETLALIETDLRYQMTTQAVSNRFALLRTAIGGGA